MLSRFLAALSREADLGGTEYTGTFMYCEGGGQAGISKEI